MKHILTLIVLCTALPALGQDVSDIEKIGVYGQTPLSYRSVGEESAFGSVQTITAQALAQSQAISLAEHMKNQLVSLHINDVQNNPFQPDVQYRGFTASPLLGLPQGISVYVNGVRFNEPFGDTVNWDLIPLAALDTVALYSGSNPVFGQNTLGGALALQTKSGFTFSHNELEARMGSFGQQQFTVQSGGNKGHWGYYIVANSYQEDGWRDYSDSELQQMLATLSYASDVRKIDVTFSANNNEMLGNGAIPEQLAELASRSAIYTQPDQTNTDFQQFSIKADNIINDNMSWQANAYYRQNEINSINGDDSDYEECGFGSRYSLCEEADDGALERVHFVGYDEDIWLSDVSDIDADDVDGTFNTGFTDSESYGGALQYVQLSVYDTINNEFIFGLGMDQAEISFKSNTEFAVLHNGSITDDRSVTGIGLFDMESRVNLKVTTKQHYLYFSNTTSLTEHLTLNLAGRYNYAEVSMRDQIETGKGSLNGEHVFHRFNPAIAINYSFNSNLALKLSYSESSRTPSPAELSCADEEDPCKLPNGFVADPPLEQVVAKTTEASLHYTKPTFSALATVFSTLSYQDIIFQQAGQKSNQGYFINLDKTQRQGLELALNTQLGSDVDFGASYNFLKATFESPFIAFSPVNPLGPNRQVKPGDNIPGQPEHQFKFHLDWQLNDQINAGTEFLYASSSYYRGDEANENKKISSYAVTNIYLSYQVNEQLRLSAKVDNLFDRHFDTFGTYGEADEVLGEIYPDTDFEAYFVGPSRPRAISVSVNYQF
ncbi:TonB-dependent receptor [Colwellia ponticola]|uniref:TonB-dependent receptor n=1 Tax=Colwellia ponticola TaxID=2304625 RepID=A0A8H2JR24_9GAMM|nr:TonB-dependent receptor [Colwellia ponticola]TMM47604.1 TonB-dependent receptor [Colwellia ponticola]